MKTKKTYLPLSMRFVSLGYRSAILQNSIESYPEIEGQETQNVDYGEDGDNTWEL